MPIFLTIPADELRTGEKTLQVLDRELFSLGHGDRQRPLAAGCDLGPAGGGASREVADLPDGPTGVERRSALWWRSHVVTARFLRGGSVGTHFPGLIPPGRARTRGSRSPCPRRCS